MKFLDDIQIGERRDIGSFTFTAESIKRFAARYDPQPFHLDEAAAARSHFGGLVASGWHTASVCLKLSIEDKLRLADEMRARGETPAKSGPSPGFSNLRWLKPVFAGDTLHYVTETSAKRELASRPGWGLIFTRNFATNQHGVLVLEFEGSIFVERRPSSTA